MGNVRQRLVNTSVVTLALVGLAVFSLYVASLTGAGDAVTHHNLKGGCGPIAGDVAVLFPR